MSKTLKIFMMWFVIVFSFNVCRKSPTDNDGEIQYTYHEGEPIPNTEIFVPMEKFDGIPARPIVSPDCLSIAYYKIYTPRDSFGLYLKNLLTGEERFLVKDGMFPDWSPNGKWIAFNLGRRVYKIRTTGENLTQLTFPISYFGYNGSEFDADWSPDGEKIAYQYDIDSRSGVKGGVYTMNTDGSQKLWLYPAGEPDWHPKGTKMIVSKGIFNLTTNEFTQIFDGIEDQFSPQYSPDGNRIVFLNEKGIWVMNSDGTGLKRILPNDLSPDRFPDYKGGIKLLVGRASWYPDGKHLIYTHFKVTRYTIHSLDDITPEPLVKVEGYMSFYKVNVDSAIAISNLP